MSDILLSFERVARRAKNVGAHGDLEDAQPPHPFDQRNIHPEIAAVAQKLFDNGHYSQSTFEAFKYIENQIKSLSGKNGSGFSLMMNVFKDTNPSIRLTDLISQSDTDEQIGYRHIFSGVMSAIRNPRGHELVTDPIDRCLDHLSLASLLLRRLQERKSP